MLENSKVQEVIKEHNLTDKEVGKSPLEEVIDPTPEPTLYDATRKQKVEYKITDGGNEYHMKMMFAPLEGAEDVLAEFDRLRSVLIDQDGDNTDITTDGNDAVEYFFDEMCIDIDDGFGTEKSENWKADIPAGEKAAAVGKLLAVRTKPFKGNRRKAPRNFAKAITNGADLIAYFDGEAVEPKITLNEGLTNESAYSEIKSKIRLTADGLDDSKIKLPAQMKAKADLARKMSPVYEGYVGEPPIHHLALAVTIHFEPNIEKIEKK